MTAFVVTEIPEGWLLPLAGMRVRSIGEESDALTVGLELDDETSEVSGLRPLRPADSLVGQTVKRVTVSKVARLEVLLEDGSLLAADSRDRVEAWEVIGPGGVRVFASTVAGEEPAIWDDSSESFSFE